MILSGVEQHTAKCIPVRAKAMRSARGGRRGVSPAMGKTEGPWVAEGKPLAATAGGGGGTRRSSRFCP